MLESLDWQILYFIRDEMASANLDVVMRWITRLGDYGVIWLAIAATAMLFKRTRYDAARILIALTIGWIITNLLLKPWIARVRPFDIDEMLKIIIPRPGDFSFPSGHTTSSFAAAAAISYSGWKCGLPAFILAALIALSRVYLLVHFPTDVICSIFIGLSAGIISNALVSYIKNKQALACGRRKAGMK